MQREALMGDSEAVPAALATLREAHRPVAGEFGGYGLAEACQALLEAWCRHLDMVLSEAERSERDG
jgi:hypothetical protein